MGALGRDTFDPAGRSIGGRRMASQSMWWAIFMDVWTCLSGSTAASTQTRPGSAPDAPWKFTLATISTAGRIRQGSCHGSSAVHAAPTRFSLEGNHEQILAGYSRWRALAGALVGARRDRDHVVIWRRSEPAHPLSVGRGRAGQPQRSAAARAPPLSTRRRDLYASGPYLAVHAGIRPGIALDGSEDRPTCWASGGILRLRLHRRSWDIRQSWNPIRAGIA